MLRSFLDWLLYFILKSRRQAQRREVSSNSLFVFENVQVLYDKGFVGAMKFTLAFLFRIILVFGPLVFFLLYLDHGSNLFSQNLANDQIYTWGFVFVMLTLIVFSGYFAHGHHSDMSGLGTTYDLKELIKSKFSLFVSKDGLYGVTKVRWKSIRFVEGSASQEARIYLKKRLLLPLPSYSYRIKFSSQEDLNRFIDLALETLRERSVK
ncbi:MAG: hypothetical protein KC877_02310 [Candidatus Kaiserbacteria bacterium]|nr:hypothetical protein [Candidatus Kaiserbacteria bacterium]MCB9816842.1 hypothetical protein [Candidatus Nomurabacteria bacterium]